MPSFGLVGSKAEFFGKPSFGLVGSKASSWESDFPIIEANRRRDNAGQATPVVGWFSELQSRKWKRDTPRISRGIRGLGNREQGEGRGTLEGEQSPWKDRA
jgi:hypothetical protein